MSYNLIWYETKIVNIMYLPTNMVGGYKKNQMLVPVPIRILY